ncbi:phosphoglycerate dehydrogenase [Staphylococcus sp. SQ8-PEA]|uniref:Phosphoglycerate dehydrogenase n=1 Tax=Staphylococcus marylandisciuri TaxID=2981529 RepID=A0ABT2QQI4_9STAP|nr:phosphoglycerate dehydrogenase [Staphylococcus marylandisciuri]MCU5746244.1 phosphoglycerate dehydrogenase [Staphylococcus marylandisciuri]
MKVISMKRLRDNEARLIDDFPDLDFQFKKGINEITDEEAANVDILIGYDGKLDAEFLKKCPRLRWIAWYATGVNNLPLDYIQRNNIKLTNAKGVHAKQMSEFILAFILDDYKKMKQSFINQQKHIYDSKLTGRRVAGETALFLGTGQIAQKTARLLEVMGLKLIGVNTTGHKVQFFDETYSIEELDKALPKADIIVNSLPETEQTYHLLEEKHFKLMKETCLFINVGRGTIVNETTLIEALENGSIRHATLDVFENEPLPDDHPFYDMENVSLTAHITGNGLENYTEGTDIFEKNLNHFLNKGELIENEIDPMKGY